MWDRDLKIASLGFSGRVKEKRDRSLGTIAPTQISVDREKEGHGGRRP